MPSDQPNVLFLLSDEHNFRCAGSQHRGTHEPVYTPTFDGLATDGTEFMQAYCQMPLCTPSRLSLLTGRRAPGAGAWRNGSVLPDDAETIPTALGRSGYETCLVGKMHLGGDRQFAGFDDRPYGDLTGGAGHQWEPLARASDTGIRDRTRESGVTEIPESELQEYRTLRESVSWIRTQAATSDAPWFLTASFSRPHFPLTAPRRHLRRYWDLAADAPTDRLTEPSIGPTGDTADHPLTVTAIEGFGTEAIDHAEQQRARAAYFACVDFLDEIVGELLGTLDREGHLENTIVVYASDHGELAGEHGLWWKHTWHEAATRVPMFIQTPAHREGTAEPARIRTPVGLVDLFPTLCRLTDADPPADLDGIDLSGAVRRGVEPERGPVVCDNLVPRWGAGTEFRLVRDGQFKYVGFRDAPEILVDLEADPAEQRNLAADPERSADGHAALDRLRAFVDDTLDFDAAASARRRADARAETAALDVSTTSPSGNCYHRRDGRIVDADLGLYEPDVVTADPGSTFADYPDPDDD